MQDMMGSASISFACPACNERLAVPRNLAGVIGPCPRCHVLIQAPHLVNPPQQGVSHTKPHPQQPHAPRGGGDRLQHAILPAEPRQLRNRSEVPEMPARNRANNPSGRKPVLGGYVPPPQRRYASRISRYSGPVAFLFLALGVIYGVKSFLQKDMHKRSSDQTAKALHGGEKSKVEPILPPDDDTFEALTNSDVEEAANDKPQAVDEGIHTLEVLEKFLAMKTLEERMPHIESKRPESDLANSVLNGPLPEILNISMDVREVNTMEQVVDQYFHVDFSSSDNGVNPQTMLVRIRASGDPKVVVDPFLDLYGGGFARYAEKPTEEAGTFQVIISAGAFCYDDVPSPDKKHTLNILSREDTEEIAKAYFGKQSEIGAMLEDETSGLLYAKAQPCTLFVRWNMEEDPEKPFLEALAIKTLDWNP